MALKALFYPDVKFETLYIPHIYREIYFEGVYIDIFNQKKDMTVIDVGANIGIVTQYMRDYAKKVYAIEPSPEHFEALKKNVEFNKWDNVETFECAISSIDGEAELSQFEPNRTSHSIALDHGGKKVKVKTVRFDTFFAQNKIKEVDFVKFDVEGAEDMILRSEGFKNVADKIKAIEVEFHFPSFRELINYMIGLGYQARRYDSSAVIVLFTR